MAQHKNNSMEILSVGIVVALVAVVVLSSEYDLIGKGYAFVGKVKGRLPANIFQSVEQAGGRNYQQEIPPTSTSPKTDTKQKNCGCIAEVSVTYTCTYEVMYGTRKGTATSTMPCNSMRFYGPLDAVTCKAPSDCTTACNNFVKALQKNLPKDQVISKCPVPAGRYQEYQAIFSQWSANENVCKDAKNTKKVTLIPPITCS